MSSKASSSSLPRHRQISQWIEDRIKDQTFVADQQLPSENELAKTFEVSRVTVRRALQTLENAQLIDRHQGVGSFVKDRRVGTSPLQLSDFEEDMKQAGRKATSVVVEHGLVSSNGKIVKSLELEGQPKVVKISRVRKGDGYPIAYDDTYLPVFYGQLLEGQDLEQKTIYDILENEYEITIEKGCLHISASVASKALAHHLQIDPGAPLLTMERISYSIQNRPIYFQRRYYRPDAMVLEIMAERSSEQPSQEHFLPLKEFHNIYQFPDKN